MNSKRTVLQRIIDWLVLAVITVLIWPIVAVLGAVLITILLVSTLLMMPFMKWQFNVRSGKYEYKL